MWYNFFAIIYKKNKKMKTKNPIESLEQFDGAEGIKPYPKYSTGLVFPSVIKDGTLCVYIAL